RNVTPFNILRDSTTGATKLGNVMLAKSISSKDEEVSHVGELVGDVAYMSPERTRGMKVGDARSDLYGLGAVIYALLTGHPPCEGKTIVEKITRIRQVMPDSPSKFQ